MQPRITLVFALFLAFGAARAQRIQEAEYYWDVDPGAGNAAPLVAFDGDFNTALEAITAEASALPSEGAHVLHVRAKDASGVWSLPFRVVVDVAGGSASFPQVRVSFAEYYLNDDPGPGSGTPMLAVDGDFSSALEAIQGGGIPAPVIAGANTLWLRARDASMAWGPSFGIVVNIDTTIAGTVRVPEESLKGMRLSPNPTTSTQGFMLHIEGLVPQARIIVHDGAGRVLVEHAAVRQRSVAIDLRNAAPGLYFVGVVVAGRQRWERLVVH